MQEHFEYLKAAKKLTKQDIYNTHIYVKGSIKLVIASEEVFNKLWAKDKNTLMWVISSLSTNILVDDPEWGEGREVVVHSPMCDDDESHWLCAMFVNTGAPSSRNTARRARKKFLEMFHPEVLKKIYSEVFTVTQFSREAYAGSLLVADEHWDVLAEDKRPVMNALTYNWLLPEATARKIISEHKTGWLRMQIARNTDSKALLDDIWNGTKSEQIRAAVVRNGISERYKDDASLELLRKEYI